MISEDRPSAGSNTIILQGDLEPEQMLEQTGLPPVWKVLTAM